MTFVYPNVDAIAFNSSPVTKAGLKIQKGNHRTSVWESGEGVELARTPVSWVRPRWQDVQRIKFRFLHGSPVKQHGMERLALDLIKLGAIKSNQLQAITAGRCTK
jgi:hypothetical protein